MHEHVYMYVYVLQGIGAPQNVYAEKHVCM